MPPLNRVGSMNRVASTANLLRHVTAGGRAEYIGVALPIDVTMLFEVSSVARLIVIQRVGGNKLHSLIYYLFEQYVNKIFCVTSCNITLRCIYMQVPWYHGYNHRKWLSCHT